jgi:hypothetical protein
MAEFSPRVARFLARLPRTVAKESPILDRGKSHIGGIVEQSARNDMSLRGRPKICRDPPNGPSRRFDELLGRARAKRFEVADGRRSTTALGWRRTDALPVDHDGAFIRPIGIDVTG